MVTYGEVKRSPTTPTMERHMATQQEKDRHRERYAKGGPEGGPGKDFELAIRELIDSNKNQFDKQAAVNALRTQAELLDKDYSWSRSDGTNPEDVDLDDPVNNPLGARPAPAKATRADEATAPEPDSGSAVDRRAAAAGADAKGREAAKNAPPSDRDAVEAKEGAKAADASLSQDEHDDLVSDPAGTEGRKKGSARPPR
jgi:hypothetical protein